MLVLEMELVKNPLGLEITYFHCRPTDSMLIAPIHNKGKTYILCNQIAQTKQQVCTINTKQELTEDTQ